MVADRIRALSNQLFLPKVRDVMSAPVITIDTNDPVMKATELMLTQGIGSVIVTSGGAPIGIFTRHDLLDRVLMKRLDINQTTVASVMSSPLVSASPDDNLSRAMDIMKTHGVTRIAVFKKGELVGLLTETDIKIKFRKGYFSMALMLKRFAVDTIAYVTFWSGISTFIQIFILKLTWFQIVAGATIGLGLTVLLAGVFGRYLDLWRRKLDV